MADKIDAVQPWYQIECTNLPINTGRYASEDYKCHIVLVKGTIADIFRDIKTSNLSFEPIWRRPIFAFKMAAEISNYAQFCLTLW